MIKSIEVQGRTEDEAIETALQQLGLSRDDVSVEILETAKTGLFGLKNTPAVIKVEYESDDVPEIKTAMPKSSVTKETSSADESYAPVDSKIISKTEEYLKGLFERMDMEVSMNITEKDGTVNVVLDSADPGILIGRRGETLDALQHLVNYSINRTPAGRVRIHLDAENYRKRRSESLENLALRTAGKVMKYRRNMTLDPMNAYERHIIHSALQGHDHVSTFSVGNDASRRVVVAYGNNKTNKDSGESPQFKEWS